MATLLELVESGALDTIDPLEGDELAWRTLYGTTDFLGWMDGGLENQDHNELYSNLSPKEQVFTTFVEYVAGEPFSSDRRFKKLKCTPDHYVWEFKTDEVRIFGWVPRKNCFICCYGASKDEIQILNSYGRYIALTANVRSTINLDDPKCLMSGSYEDVISDAN
jgi:hypothetical protein